MPVCLSCSLNDLAEFIKVADVGLTQSVEEGDYNGLVAVMGHLMAVKDRQTVTDEMFEPLKQTIELLKTYGQEMPEEVHTQLQVQTSRNSGNYNIRERLTSFLESRVPKTN